MGINFFGTPCTLMCIAFNGSFVSQCISAGEPSFSNQSAIIIKGSIPACVGLHSIENNFCFSFFFFRFDPVLGLFPKIYITVLITVIKRAILFLFSRHSIGVFNWRHNHAPGPCRIVKGTGITFLHSKKVPKGFFLAPDREKVLNTNL